MAESSGLWISSEPKKEVAREQQDFFAKGEELQALIRNAQASREAAWASTSNNNVQGQREEAAAEQMRLRL